MKVILRKRPILLVSMSHKELVIDYRERDVIKQITTNYPNISPIITENLPIGDILFRVKEKPVFIIERKTVSDLIASIKDGRYRNQKNRLKLAIEPSRCLYLIEGNLPSVDCHQIQNLSIKSVYGSLIHTMVRDHNFVFRTQSLEESVAFISDFATRWFALPTDWFQVDLDKPTTDIPFQMKKRGDISTTTCFEYQLAQIPSISLTKAKIISAKFPSMQTLITHLNSTSQSDRVHNLAELVVTNVDGKSRKIGKSSANKIIDFLGFL